MSAREKPLSCRLAYHRILGVKGTYELVLGPYDRWHVYLNGNPGEMPFPKYSLARSFVNMFDELEENTDVATKK